MGESGCKERWFYFERETVSRVNTGNLSQPVFSFKCCHGDQGILQKPCCKLKPLLQNGPLWIYLTHFLQILVQYLYTSTQYGIHVFYF